MRLRPLLTAALCVAAMTGAVACSNTTTNSVPAIKLGVAAVSAGGQTKVTYCNRQRAKITEPVKHDGPAPALVYVHGGSWVSGNFDTGGFLINEIGPALVASGFVVMSVDYRLGPTAKWPDQIEDVKCAVRYLRANATALGVKPGEIGTWGQSAGGHLASLLGTAGPRAGWDLGAYTDESSRVEAVVDMAGPSDLPTMTDLGDSGNVRASFISLLNGDPPKNLAGLLRTASPVTYIRPGDPPFLILHSDDDEIVYPQQSQELAWDLAANHDPVQLVVVHGGGHNFDQAGETPDIAQITAMIVTFFVAHLHPHG